MKRIIFLIAKHLARLVLIVGMTILPLVAFDILHDGVKARSLWRRLRWTVRDRLAALKAFPNKLPVLLSYELGIAQRRWLQMRTQLEAGGYADDRC
jgi:hypothetical protein